MDLVLKSDHFLAPPSNARLELPSRYLAKPALKPQAKNPSRGRRRTIRRTYRGIGTLYVSPKNFVLRLEAPFAYGFVAFLLSRLEPLHEDYAR